MNNKIKWILVLFLFPSVGYSSESCNPSSWNHNLNQFNQLEASYNKHVKVFNALLIEHKQRPLLSKTFGSEELAILWRVRARKDILQTQLDTSIKYHQQLSQNAETLSKLSTQSVLSANAWEKLGKSCKNKNDRANQITAEWYQINAAQLADDYTSLSSQYLGLANLYGKEATTLQLSKKEETTND